MSIFDMILLDEFFKRFGSIIVVAGLILIAYAILSLLAPVIIGVLCIIVLITILWITYMSIHITWMIIRVPLTKLICKGKDDYTRYYKVKKDTNDWAKRVRWLLTCKYARCYACYVHKKFKTGIKVRDLIKTDMMLEAEGKLAPPNLFRWDVTPKSNNDKVNDDKEKSK